MEDPQNPQSVVFRARGADNTALTRAREAFKKTREYEEASPEEQIQLLAQLRQNILDKRYV